MYNRKNIQNFTIYLLAFLPIISFGQTIYKGNVVDKISKEKIPFATVGLIKANAGINADENGKFILQAMKEDHSDTLLISCIGYHSAKIPLSALPTDNLYLLEKKNAILKEVVIGKRTYEQSTTLNELSGCNNHYFGTVGYTVQIAQHFKAPVEYAKLSEVRICTGVGKKMFRLRVYEMDTVTNLPTNDVADTIIEIKTSKSEVRVNVEEYNIVIPGKDFFVAVEWLKVPYNEKYMNIEKNGVKSIQLWYQPLVGKVHNYEVIGSTNDFGDGVLQKNYKGEWFKIYTKTILLISAKVKY